MLGIVRLWLIPGHRPDEALLHLHIPPILLIPSRWQRVVRVQCRQLMVVDLDGVLGITEVGLRILSQ